ncbi:Helicase-like transcription factor CHR27, partial [Mucuna pruriens]
MTSFSSLLWSVPQIITAPDVELRAWRFTTVYKRALTSRRFNHPTVGTIHSLFTEREREREGNTVFTFHRLIVFVSRSFETVLRSETLTSIHVRQWSFVLVDASPIPQFLLHSLVVYRLRFGTDQEQQPRDDAVREDETNGQCSNNKDKGVSSISSDSDTVSGSDSGSDYEDEELGGSLLPDLNEEPASSISVSGGEDSDSDSSDGGKPSAKREKALLSRGKRKFFNTEIGEPSDVARVVEYKDDDNEYSMVQQQSVPSVPKVTKKRKYTRKARNGDTRPVLLWNAWEEEQERWIDKNILEDVDVDDQSEVMNETAEAPSELTMPLLRYQNEWLAWALKQENSASRGGILADEMGMGKTIQAIALVLAKREFQQSSCEPDQSIPCSSGLLPVIKGTLVICPVVAVTQWVSEIDRFTLKGSTKVLIYHGANRWKSGDRFADYDFVITTYSVVESEYRKHMMPPKERCPYCGKLFLPSKLIYHQNYFCGPDAVRTEKQSKQAKKKNREVTKGKTKECDSNKMSKGSRKKKEEEMCTIIGDSEAVPVRTDRSILHAVQWQRIILDEAHYIKSRHCNTAKAVLALESTYKWALSGTPLQNRVGELYSLIRFLQITPYSYYLCKDCDCRILDHRYDNSLYQ